MKIKLIGCKVLLRELYALCAHSVNSVEIIWMEAALHEDPKKLRAAIQRVIDDIDSRADPECEAIALGFGLCSMGVAGLRARSLPIIVPRAHDCITMLLGSRATYQRLFDARGGGIYWYSPGWIEQMKVGGRDTLREERYLEYVEKYGEDNAEYLMEIESGWTREYSCAALIEWPQFAGNPAYAALTRRAAEESGLEYLRVEGSPELLRKLVDGEWDQDFLYLPPGNVIRYSADERVMRAEDCEARDD